MKGASNRYGNTRGSGGQGKPSTHINYQWAKYFNKNTLDTHFDKHGKSMGFSSKTEYEQHAIKFANTVDKKNCVSFIDKNGSTYKYNKKTNELAIINKDGTVILILNLKADMIITNNKRKRRYNKMDEKKYIATDCPVCNEFYFSELTEEDVQDGDDGLSRFCHVCGWKYNVEQINEPSVKNIEGFDIHQLKNRFLDLRKQDKKYNYLLSIAPKSEKHECPVCGKYLFKNVDDHDICPFCHWENDSYGESNPNSDGGANDISLNEAKHIWNSKN